MGHRGGGGGSKKHGKRQQRQVQVRRASVQERGDEQHQDASSRVVVRAEPTRAAPAVVEPSTQAQALRQSRFEVIRDPRSGEVLGAIALNDTSAAGGDAASRLQWQQAMRNQQWPQWPGGDEAGKPYPPMPSVSDQVPLLKSLGATGTQIYGGFITSEEYNEDLNWRDAVKVYDQMFRNDGQIGAVVQQLEMPIRRTTWAVEPASDDPRDQEIASFVESALFEEMRYETTNGDTLTQTWDEILRHILMHLHYGFMVFEINWRVEDGWVKWARWTPLLPRTIWRWWVGEDNELVGVNQYTFKDYAQCYVDIPAEKLLLFSHRREGNNYEGISILRSAYKHWFFKDQYYRIQSIGIERCAVAIPVLVLPESFTADDISAAQTILGNLRVGAEMGVTIPPGWQLTYLRTDSKSDESIQPAIDHHDTLIARSVLAQFVNLGSTETGAYALADAQIRVLMEALQAVCKYIEGVINADAIPRLVDYNYRNVAVYPKLRAGKVALVDVAQIAAAIHDLNYNKDMPLIRQDQALEDFLRDKLGLPSAPKSVVETTNPSKDEQDLAANTDTQDQDDAGSDVNDVDERTDAGSDAGEAPMPSDAESQDVKPRADQRDGGSGPGAGQTAVAAQAGATSIQAAEGAETAEALAREARLLREALGIIYGAGDAVERGKQHKEAVRTYVQGE